MEGDNEIEMESSPEGLTTCEMVAEHAKVPLTTLGNRVTLANIITSTNFFLDPDPTSIVVVKDQEWMVRRRKRQRER